MPFLTAHQINTSPLTASHLRVILNAIRNLLAYLSAATADAEAITDAAIATGQPVYVVSTGHVALAQNDDNTHAQVAGICSTGAGSGSTATFLSRGKVELADWTAIIGTSNLTPGAVYYLSSTAGLMTATAPTTVGQWSVRLGRATTTKIFDIQIEPGILL